MVIKSISIKSILYFPVLLVLSWQNAFAESVDTYLARLESKLDVKIIYKKKVKDTWDKSTYQIPTNKAHLMTYLRLIEQEYSKYPVGYLKKARAGILVLTKNFAFDKNKQAAMPDPYGNRLYLAHKYSNKLYSETYLIHVLHHELHHNTEYVIWKNQYYKWPKWYALNKPEFKYGSGGIAAYSDRSTNYYKMDNPIPGFVNLYSALGQEEDRSEIFALMMSDIERPILNKICKEDPVVRAKVKVMAKLIDDFTKQTGKNSYWRSKNQACIESIK